MELTNEVKDLFHRVKTRLGAPIRRIELDDNAMCDILQDSIGDYSAYIQNWVIESQWLTLQAGKTFFQNPQEVAYAMTTRNLDWSRDYSEWFSKEVGLSQRGTKWELQKDFFKIEKGKQVYVVPAGREINKVLWITPPTTKTALYGTTAGIDTGIGGGIAQFGNSVGGMGLSGFYVGSVYDSALLAADLKYKNSMLRGDLAYKVTAGPEGTHLIHLLSVPGSQSNINTALDDTNWGWSRFANCYCWYTYYDVSSEDDATACMLENADSVLISPDQVPMNKMQFELLNDPAQQQVRQLLYANCAITIANIRGYASGIVSIPNAQMTLDYNMLLSQGKEERDRVFNELKERLDRMLPWNLMKNQSDLTDALMKVLQQKPLGFYIR